MRKYIFITLGTQRIKVDIDDDLLRKLQKSLKRNLEFDSDGCLKTEFESDEASYRVKQTVLKSLLDEINTYNINPDLKDKLDYLKSQVSFSKGTFYSSDLVKLESVLGEVTTLYDNVKRDVPKKTKEDLQRELKEKISSAKTAQEKLEAVEEVIDNALDNPELSEYLTEEKVQEVIDSIAVTDSDTEYEDLNSEVLDTEEESLEATKQVEDKKIVVSPKSSVEDIVLEVMTKVSAGTPIEEAVEELKINNEYKGDVVASLNKLSSNINVHGLNHKNLNYFGDSFINECERIARESGQNIEDMFRDYFSSSSSTRANSVLNRFILQFITRNGNDSSLRGLIEATLVKKAVSKHLISNRFNSYLEDKYKYLDVNGSGYIYFNEEENRNVETTNEVSSSYSETTNTTSSNETANSSTEYNINTNINSSININGNANQNININRNIGESNPYGVHGEVNKRSDISQDREVKAPINGVMPETLNGAQHQTNRGARLGVPKTGNTNGIEGTPTGGTISNNNSLLNEIDPNINVGDTAAPGMIPINSGKVPSTSDGAFLGADSPDTVAAIGMRNKVMGAVANKRGTQASSIGAKGFRKNNLLNQAAMNGDGTRGVEPGEISSGGTSDSDTGALEGDIDNSDKDASIDNTNIGDAPTVNNEDSPKDSDTEERIEEKKKKQIEKIIIEFIKKHPSVAIGTLIVVVVLFFLLIIIASYNNNKNDFMGLGGYPYIGLDNVCTEIYVYDTPSGEDGTYPLEEYVAGVVAHEVGAFNNDTMYEVFAIAARTYALRRLQNSSDCSIPGNTTAQVFGKTTNERIIEAANNTRGIVLTQNGSLMATEYDAFCWDTKDANYYNVCQKNYDTGETLRVPVAWAEEYVGKISGKKFLTTPRYQSHGRGMSQDGAFYLASEQGYTRDQILTFFYGSESRLMSIYASAYTGEFPIDPNDPLYQNLEFLVNRSLDSLLLENMTTTEDFNNYLATVAEESGVGTRESVVNVAVSLIGSLANMGYKLNYQWGGKYYFKGVNSNWGTATNPSNYCGSYGAKYNINKCLTNYKWLSFDCSGFVNWAFINGFNLNSLSELQSKGIFRLTQTSSASRKGLNANTAVCQAGDVLIKPGAHIVLIVGVDESNKKYIVAESTGSNIQTKTGGVKLSYYNYNASGYFCGDMSSIYKNNSVEEE